MCPPALSFRVTSPRKPTRLPRPIPRAELDAILAELAPVGGDLVRLRTRALFHTLLSSGARISEVLSLDRDQIRDRSAVVVQKGGSQKLILISETAELAIADYLEARSDGCPALFAFHGYGRHWLSVLAGTHKTLRPSRLTIKGVQWAWDGLSADLGVARWTSHMIRHTCATELLRQGVDSLIVARHLGHTGLQTIATYAEVGLSCRQSMLEVFDQRIRRAS